MKLVHPVCAGIACTSGLDGVRMEDVMMTTEQNRILILTIIRKEKHGATGIKRENRSTGAEAGVCIRRMNASNLSSTQDRE